MSAGGWRAARVSHLVWRYWPVSLCAVLLLHAYLGWLGWVLYIKAPAGSQAGPPLDSWTIRCRCNPKNVSLDHVTEHANYRTDGSGPPPGYLDKDSLAQIQEQVTAQRTNDYFSRLMDFRGYHSRHRRPRRSKQRNAKDEVVILLWPYKTTPNLGSPESELFPQEGCDCNQNNKQMRNCAYTNCRLSTDAADLSKASLVLINHPTQDDSVANVPPKLYASPSGKFSGRGAGVRNVTDKRRQGFALFSKESEAWYDAELSFPDPSTFNYLISYKFNSDVVLDYYERLWMERADYRLPPEVFERKRLAYQYISNCAFAKNPKRERYNRELSARLDVDTFGLCTGLTDGCPDEVNAAFIYTPCTEKVMRRYMFYLSFENSLCTDYITEKFYRALAMYNIPVVMGAPKEDYEKIVPPGSFIHVDDFASVSALADHMSAVVRDKQLFMSYHLWRYTDFYPLAMEDFRHCELCRLANELPDRTCDLRQVWNRARDCRSAS